MSQETKKTAYGKSSKMKGALAAIAMPILGVGAALVPGNAKAGTTSGYGASADYRVSNVVQFFQGSTQRQNGTKEALLSYTVDNAYTARNMNYAKSQFSKKTLQLEKDYAKRKAEAENRFQYAQRQGNVSEMVRAYSSLVQAGKSYIIGQTSAHRIYADEMTRGLNNTNLSALRADQNIVAAINRGNQTQSQSLNSVRAGAGITGNISDKGSWGAGISGSVGDVLQVTRSADEFGRAQEIQTNADTRAQSQLLMGTNIYNDVALAVAGEIVGVQEDLKVMENVLNIKTKSVRDYNVKSNYESAKLDAQYQVEIADLMEDIQWGKDTVALQAAQQQLQGQRASNQEYNKASQNLQKSTKGIGVGGKLRSIFGGR